MNERERLRIQRVEAQSGSTVQRVGRVRREGDPASSPQESPRRRRSAAAVLGAILLVIAAVGVLGVLAFLVFGRGDGDLAARGGATASASVSSGPTRTPLRGLTGGTPSPTASATPTASPTPSARPTPSTTPPPATPTASPPPPPTPPPPPQFSASVQVCRDIGNGECFEELRTVNPSHGTIFLLAQVENASSGDVIGFEVSGPQGVVDAGSVVLEGAGSGYAYVEFSMQERPRGTYTVTVTRNGESAARTSFVRVGG